MNTEVDDPNGSQGSSTPNARADNSGSASSNSNTTGTSTSTGTPTGNSASTGNGTPVDEASDDDEASEDDEAPFNACESYDFRIAPEPVQPTGTAQLSLPATTDAEASVVELSEVTCETFHDEAGNTVGFGASFFATWESTDFSPHSAAVKWLGEFTGDGEYSDASLSEWAVDDSFQQTNSFGRGTLTLSEGGRVGSITTLEGVSLNFSCGDTSKISVSPKTWSAELPPGTLRVAGGPDGVVYEISGIECGQEASDDFVIRLDSPFLVDLITMDESAASGEHPVRVNLDYAGLGAVILEVGDMNLACGSPASGTLDIDSSPGYTGSFVCQE